MILKTDSPGTRNLIPERFKEAREARGFALDEFAEMLGITKQAVAQYETGQISPAAPVMSKIIALTQQPPAFFTTARQRSAEQFRSPFWRSLRRMERHHRQRIARRLEWAHDICKYVEQFIELPHLNLPSIAFDPESASENDIEAAAEAVRDHWELGRGPIKGLPQILEVNGVVLIKEDVGCNDMDAVARWQGGRPFILYSNEVTSGPRAIYNLAHELGHIILHSTIDLDVKNLDAVEKQANRFAGAFLLPRTSFPNEVVSTSIKYFEYLKQRWGVSIAAMVYRCKDLQLLSKHQHSYLIRQMHAKGIKMVEPLDDAFVPANPIVLLEALKMLIGHGVQSESQIVDALGLNAADIASLCGAEPTFLEQKVVQLRLRPHLQDA